MGAWQEEWNRWASVRQIHCHRKGLEALSDNVPLGQIVADRAVRPVVTVLGVCGCDRGLLLRTKPIALAATSSQLSGMVNAQNVVQLAPKERCGA